VASAFFGAALYINIVEQPARLALHVRSMIREWIPSNRRGSIMMAVLAVISAMLAYVDYARTGDIRLLLGGTIILVSWPYAYFVMVPVNIWLYAIPPQGASSVLRELMREWGLLEWGQSAIGLAACCMYGWVLVLPAN
jgi:hypothetical protein